MNQKTGNLGRFIIISIFAHIVLFSFFPLSLLSWKELKMPAGNEFSSFYLVDFQEVVEQVKPEIKPEPPKEIPKPVEQEVKKEEIKIDVEPPEIPLESIEPSKEEHNEPIKEDTVDSVIEETIKPAELVEDLTPISEDTLIFVDVNEPLIICSDLSDEFINLPALDIPSDQSILDTIKAQVPIVEEIIEEEIVEEIPIPEPIIKEPELPSDPKLMIVKQIIPVLPKNAANEGKVGKTELYIRVQKNGSIQRVEKVVSSGDSRIDDIAIRTVDQGWQFQDFNKDYTIHLEIDFTLQQVFLNFINIFLTEDGA